MWSVAEQIAADYLCCNLLCTICQSCIRRASFKLLPTVLNVKYVSRAVCSTQTQVQQVLLLISGHNSISLHHALLTAACCALHDHIHRASEMSCPDHETRSIDCQKPCFLPHIDARL